MDRQQKLKPLLEVFRPGGPATKADLADKARISAATLNNEIGLWRPSTLHLVLMGAADLLDLDAARLCRWVDGSVDQQMEEAIARLRRVRKCTSCGLLFEPEQVHPRLGQCRPCQWTPATREWAEAIDRQIRQAPAWLQEAWVQARADLSLITLAGLAALAGKSLEEVEAAWTDAQLPRRKGGGRPRKIQALLIAALFSSLTCPVQAHAGASNGYYVNWRFLLNLSSTAVVLDEILRLLLLLRHSPADPWRKRRQLLQDLAVIAATTPRRGTRRSRSRLPALRPALPWAEVRP